MLLIYSENTSTRLQYTCRFIFEELLQMSFSLTLHQESFALHEGPKINYSSKKIEGTYRICPSGLLLEEGISPQNIQSSGEGENAVLFRTENADHPFDIFSAVFYLISRYEEYLPHEEDMYGRYAYENSIAFKAGFLNIPLVNVWVQELSKKAHAFFLQLSSGHKNTDETPTFNLQPSTFNFLPTYDIDMAWSYKEKGFLRSAGGFLRQPTLGRIAAWLGMREDPFDSYRFLDRIHSSSGLAPLYFFLVAKNTGVYDKNISPANESMQMLIREHAEKYTIGLHPSWKSNEEKELLAEEKDRLEKISGKSITSSRQHYIKVLMPQNYRRLLGAGITDDYSMGYGSINGFRASVASSFLWYDLTEEKITSLRVHPFCFMDANCFYEQKLSPEQSYDELLHYYSICKQVNGTLITIFHNNFLGTDKAFAGWRELYTRFISQLQQ